MRIQQTGPQPNWNSLDSPVREEVDRVITCSEHLRCPEVDTGYGHVTERGDGPACHRRLNPAVDTNKVHDETLSTTGPDETSAATERVGNKDEEDRATCNLHDTVDSGSKEGAVCASHSEVGENLRGVVVLYCSTSCQSELHSQSFIMLPPLLYTKATPRRFDYCTHNRVNTSHLLADHQNDGDQSSLSVGRDGRHLLEQHLCARVSG